MLPVNDPSSVYQDLVRIGLVLTRETDLAVLLERILTEARRFTGAEAGTLYLQDGERLHFSVVQNDLLSRRLGLDEMRRALQAEPLRLDESSLAGHVARTGDVLNLHDSYMIPPDRPYDLDGRVDARLDYRTRSVLVVPLPDPSGKILGVLQLINALDRDGGVIAFDSQYEGLVRFLASQAAVALRNARLEALAIKDALTEAYNRRYLLARLEEECRRHKRTGEPVSLVFVDLDRFRSVNDGLGLAVGDALLRDVARLLIRHSRDFTVVSRCGDDEFGVLLAGTPKTGALAYAERVRQVIEQQAFPYGAVTASIGVAALPDDVATAEDLLRAGQRASRAAKGLGRNRVSSFGAV
jgi:diguanylate cyclase (GGDEF)-like protein